MAMTPPQIREGFFRHVVSTYGQYGQMVANILSYTGVNVHAVGCPMPRGRVPNPLGIMSFEMAVALAWDKVLRM